MVRDGPAGTRALQPPVALVTAVPIWRVRPPPLAGVARISMLWLAIATFWLLTSSPYTMAVCPCLTVAVLV